MEIGSQNNCLLLSLVKVIYSEAVSQLYLNTLTKLFAEKGLVIFNSLTFYFNLVKENLA